jgi:SAM-dependent methyltransferase
MKEVDIRPTAIFNEYLHLAKIDTKEYFASALRSDISCPACDSLGKHTFDKNDFAYCLCEKCQTLFVSPRPEAEAFNDYYTNSPSSKYWATTFYKETAEARRQFIWEPKAQLISEVLDKYRSTQHQVIDIGGGYGIFAEEMQKIFSEKVIIVEPAPHLADVCRKKGFIVIEKFLEDMVATDVPNGSKTFVSFELFEHLHDPEKFLQNLLTLMNSGDIFIFTTLSSTGLDIQVLWENSPSVSPPHHLNFFNPDSVGILLEKSGYDLLEVSTPGKLDIDILSNNGDKVKDQFWKTFLQKAGDDCKQKWQSMITQSGWSSHMMVVCKKK